MMANGLDLSRAYFQQAALPLLRAEFPALLSRCAAGLCAGGLDVGCGSEVYGYDDALSRDHNWGPRFFLFLSEEDYAASAAALRHLLHSRLPREFQGFAIRATTEQATHFHITTPLRNLKAVLGVDAPPQTDEDWYCIPECRLTEYSAGAMFHDPLGMVEAYKQRYRQYPLNVLRKRLAGAFLMTHTAGNALRCARRGEWTACRSYLDMAIASAQRAALLLHRRYPPHVKWRGRAVRDLPDLPLEWLAAMDRLSIQMPADPKELQGVLLSLLLPVGDMANRSGLIPPVAQPVEDAFLPFPCYAFSAAFEAAIQGPLAGRPLAVALDQMSEAYQPLSPAELRAHWQAGRPGIRELL